MSNTNEANKSTNNPKDEEIPDECLGCETGADCDGAHRLLNGDFHPKCCTHAAESVMREDLETLLSSCCDDAPIKNRCVECGVDMGYNNPRQLCGKTRCCG